MSDISSAPQVATLMERVLYEVKKVVVGQDHFLERVMVAILAQGHLLVEGVPGLAKTRLVERLGKTLGLAEQREPVPLRQGDGRTPVRPRR